MRSLYRKVRRLIDFAQGLAPVETRPEKIRVFFNCATPIVSGYAYGNESIDIFLPKRLFTRRYPRRFVYRKSAGALSFRCWCEEVIATAAHEVRHIAQESTPHAMRPRNYEVDAEAFARFALDIYRMRRRCRHAA